MSDGSGSLSEFGAMHLLGWSRGDLWLAFLAIGGSGSADDLDEHLRTGNHLDALQRNCLAAALNDGLMDLGEIARVRYSNDRL